MTRGGNETAAGDPRAAVDGMTHSTNTLTQKQKLYLTVLDIFGSHEAPPIVLRDETYAIMLVIFG